MGITGRSGREHENRYCRCMREGVRGVSDKFRLRERGQGQG